MEKIERKPSKLTMKAAALATSLGLSLGAGGCSESQDNWTIGVTCKPENRVKVIDVSNKLRSYANEFPTISIECADPNGDAHAPESLQLLRGVMTTVDEGEIATGIPVDIATRHGWSDDTPQVELSTDTTTNSAQIRFTDGVGSIQEVHVRQ